MTMKLETTAAQVDFAEKVSGWIETSNEVVASDWGQDAPVST